MPVWLPADELGREVRRVRERLGMSQTAFADALGLKAPGGQTIVSRWEKGRGVSGESLEKIATLAGEPVEIFQARSATALEPITAQEAVELRDLLSDAMSAMGEALAIVARATSRPGGVVPAVAPGEATRLLQRYLEEIGQAGSPTRRVSGDPRT